MSEHKRIRRTIKRRREPGEVAFLRTAVRNHCLECMGWETNPMRCTAPKCWLWPYRKSSGVDYSWPKDSLDPEYLNDDAIA